jgi:hypothetical protein
MTPKKRTKKPRRPRRTSTSTSPEVIGVVFVRAAPPKLDAAWQKAIDEVTAAMGSAMLCKNGEMRALNGTVLTPSEIARSVEANLRRAQELYASKRHDKCEGKGAMCRHMALVAAGCERAAQHVPVPYDVLFDMNANAVVRYLDSRN